MTLSRTDKSGAIDAKAAIRALTKADPVLGRAIKRHGAYAVTIHRGGTPFSLLAHAVINQQLSGKAAATIEARLVAALGGVLSPETVATAAFDVLRGAGLSRAKATTLQDLAAKTLDGTIPDFRKLDRMTDECDRRAPDIGQRRRRVDGADVPDVLAGAARHHAGRRSRRAQGIPAPL